MEYLSNYNLSVDEQEIIKKASQQFYYIIEHTIDPDFGLDRFGLKNHLEQLQKRAIFALDLYQDMNPLVIFLSIWLHDIGHYPVDEIDHAVKGEIIAIKFLQEVGADPDIIQKVAHCVRAHRNRDVFPESLEAKMIACIDSASHFTDPLMYMSILSVGKYEYLEGKLERDYRDVQGFPQIRDKIIPFYEAAKLLINEHKKFTF